MRNHADRKKPENDKMRNHADPNETLRIVHVPTVHKSGSGTKNIVY